MDIMIEPCCCERQLPQLVRDMHGRTMFFTNGDVTVNHLFKSLSYMAGPNHRLTLVVREPDVQLLRWIKNWMQRGWTTEVHLTSSNAAAQLITAELDGLLDKVTFAQDSTVQDELMAFEGERGVVVIQGRLLTAPLPGLTTYSCYQGQDRGMVRDLLLAVEARHRSHMVELTEAPTEKTTVTKTRTKSKKTNK